VPEVRRIRHRERDAALGTVVEAFRTDPQVRWYFPDDASYDVVARRFFGLLIDTRIDGGEVWIADDAAAVAMWVPPGGNLLGPEYVASRYAEVVAGLPEPAPQRIAEVDEVVDALLPEDPHWYLGVLACRPGWQKRGLAGAVIAPVLDAADRAGVPVALETSTVGNVDFYIRRGFAVLASRTTGKPAGPTIRVMRREPLTPGAVVDGTSSVTAPGIVRRLPDLRAGGAGRC
jgi:GNAT superfamily N-acetyltransferase